MANKFTQSILERQYKEAQEEKRAKKTAPVTMPVQEDEAAASESEAVAAIIETVTASAQEEPVAQPVKPGTDRAVDTVKLEGITSPEKPLTKPASASGIELNLDAYIIKGNDRVAKNKTFYLDQNVIEGIKSAAKRQKVTDSKLVNDILKKVLAI